MDPLVLEQVARLGGSYVPGRVPPFVPPPGEGDRSAWDDPYGGAHGGPLVGDLLAVSFPGPLHRPLWGVDCPLEPLWGSDLSTRDDEPSEVVGGLVNLDVLVAATQEEFPPVTYGPWVFAPFTPGSRTFGELAGRFHKYHSSSKTFRPPEGFVSEEALVRVAFGLPVEGPEPLELIMLAHCDGYPNNYVVAVCDPNPANPRVFSTDHETFLTIVQPEGTLAEFLSRFVSPDDLHAVAADTEDPTH